MRRVPPEWREDLYTLYGGRIARQFVIHFNLVTDLRDQVAEALGRSPRANLTLGGRGGEAQGVDPDELSELLAARTARSLDDADVEPDLPENEAQRRVRVAIEIADRQLKALREGAAGDERWLARRSEIVRLQSVLLSLDTMSREMSSMTLADEPAIAKLASRLDATRKVADALLAQSGVEEGEHLHRLA